MLIFSWCRPTCERSLWGWKMQESSHAYTQCSGHPFWVTERGFHCIIQLTCFALTVRDAIKCLWFSANVVAMQGLAKPLSVFAWKRHKCLFLLITLFVVLCGTLFLEVSVDTDFCVFLCIKECVSAVGCMMVVWDDEQPETLADCPCS